MTPARLHRLPAAAAALAAALVLSACALPATAPPQRAYDLGPGPAATPRPDGSLAWRLAGVTAPPWLSSEGMAYRLDTPAPSRLDHYRDNRWLAPPAALLTQRLRQQLLQQPACPARPLPLLALHLDRFEQQFSSPTQSQGVVALQATLWPQGADGPAVQQHWQTQAPAPTPDAAGGVQALTAATDALLPAVAHWVATQSCR
ncbi:ABC-type transport auxiliary lipoprotein family protein [Roseateles sp. BYS87W]|uniref:ABC-type transport auxiliary lipoprotein family protein n=1 Tax=Pelomonas baiyunensis TaxID=3299026 RepID=A0ABW7H3W5_9BURK